MKTIMLTGYLQVPNFGDVLFAHLFYRKCKALGFEAVDFYQYKNIGIGEHCRKELGYYTEKSFLNCLKANAFVIISGGSLWDDGTSKENAKVRFLRFILPARLYQLMGKPVYVLGVGGGPVETPWLRRQIIAMLNKAAVIQFRDAATKTVYESYGVKNKMTVTADTALVITQDMLEPLKEKDVLDSFAKGRKKILLHLPDGTGAVRWLSERVVPGLIRFLAEHPEYAPVLSNDNIRKLGETEQAATAGILQQLKEAGIKYYYYSYHDSWQLCSLINEMDCIVTAKLHVGVVGCVLGKCVVSFPVHREKTQNFYAMIHESDRCVHMNNTTPESAYAQICAFHNKPVTISEEMATQAQKNLDVLEQIRKR